MQKTQVKFYFFLKPLFFWKSTISGFINRLLFYLFIFFFSVKIIEWSVTVVVLLLAIFYQSYKKLISK